MTASPLRIAIDARCLQDPDYIGRGVGRHTENLLRGVPERGRVRLVGLFDPEMQPMDPAFRFLFDAMRPNAGAAGLREHDCFVSASPMTHDPLFVARLLGGTPMLKAAVVYDFIPHEFAERYLAPPGAAHAYYTCLRWLSRYDMFMPISDASGAALRRLLGVEPGRVAVTGAAVDGVFTPDDAPEGGPAPRHVMVVGGGDPRKNVECALRAHAETGALQAAQMPLVITGHYGAGDIERFRGLARQHGGAPELVQVPGRVTEAELIDGYRRALCVIGPSYAEGFDLPVVEAMACGVPALASDIPAHRELVEDAEWRFAPDDHTRLAALLERLATSPETRAALIRAQAPVAERFAAAAVAERFWTPVIRRLDTLQTPAPAPAMAPAPGGRRKPTLALLSPLPPDRSGVADYTAATCAELGRLTHLQVFTATAAPRPLEGAAQVLPLSALASTLPGLDRIVNVMGNSHFHVDIFHQLRRYGGACISHDSRMLGFYRILLGLEPAIHAASDELGRDISPAEIDRWLTDEGTLEATFLGEVARAADPLFVHSVPTAQLVQDRFGVAAVPLPFAVYRPWETAALQDREAARRRLGIGDGERLIATFGAVHPTKAPVECVYALEMLRGWGIDASLHFIGERYGTREVEDLVLRLGLSDKVRMVDSYVDEATYRDYLVGADLGLQLRLTYLGSLSGALLDCIAAGLPSVANESLAEAMDAPGYVARVPDRLSPVLIAEALAGLLERTRAAAEPERQHFCAVHSVQSYARRLCAGLGLDVR